MLQAPQISTSRLTQLAESLYATGFEALGHGDTDLAQKCFGAMAAVTPFDERPWVGLGASREQLGDYFKAAGFYKLGGAVAPRSVYCKLGEARASLRLGERQRAETLLDEAEQLTDEQLPLMAITQLRGEL